MPCCSGSEYNGTTGRENTIIHKNKQRASKQVNQLYSSKLQYDCKSKLLSMGSDPEVFHTKSLQYTLKVARCKFCKLHMVVNIRCLVLWHWITNTLFFHLSSHLCSVMIYSDSQFILINELKNLSILSAYVLRKRTVDLKETSSSDQKATVTNSMHSNDLEACGKKCCYFWFHSEVKFLTRFWRVTIKDNNKVYIYVIAVFVGTCSTLNFRWSTFFL